MDFAFTLIPVTNWSFLHVLSSMFLKSLSDHPEVNFIVQVGFINLLVKFLGERWIICRLSFLSLCDKNAKKTSIKYFGVYKKLSHSLCIQENNKKRERERKERKNSLRVY